MCPVIGDLRAIYENSSRTLKLYSSEIAATLRRASQYDKVYLEFGELTPRRHRIGQELSYAFSNDANKEHVMLSIKVTRGGGATLEVDFRNWTWPPYLMPCHTSSMCAKNCESARRHMALASAFSTAHWYPSCRRTCCWRRWCSTRTPFRHSR